MLAEDREKRTEYLMERIECDLVVHVVCKNVIHYKCLGVFFVRFFSEPKECRSFWHRIARHEFCSHVTSFPLPVQSLWTLGKWLDFFESQFLHLQNGEKELFDRIT